MYNRDLCNLCSDCLVECAWIEANCHWAIEWMKVMISGQETPVLNQCITCFACNEFCQQNANPFDLMASLQEKHHTFLTIETASAEETKYIFSRELNLQVNKHRIKPLNLNTAYQRPCAS